MASCTRRVGVSVRKHADFRITAFTCVRACATLGPVLVRVLSPFKQLETVMKKVSLMEIWEEKKEETTKKKNSDEEANCGRDDVMGEVQFKTEKYQSVKKRGKRFISSFKSITENINEIKDQNEQKT